MYENGFLKMPYNIENHAKLKSFNHDHHPSRVKMVEKSSGGEFRQK
jgi:hypothetical protein